MADDIAVMDALTSGRVLTDDQAARVADVRQWIANGRWDA